MQPSESILGSLQVEYQGESILPANQTVVFPQLRTLKFERSLSLWSENLLDLINAAPNLATVTGFCWIHEAEWENCKRLDVLTQMIVVPLKGTFEAFKSLVRAKPKLSMLQLLDSRERLMPQRWSPFLLELFEQCTFTLEKLSLCGMKFLEIQDKLAVLHRLNYLELFFAYESILGEFHSVVSRLNLQGLCPNVKSLRLRFGDSFCYHEVPPALSAYSPTCIPVHSVQEFVSKNPACPVSVVEACILSFPKLLTFGFELLACADICEELDLEHILNVYRIWTELPALEELKIGLVSPKESPQPHTLDALFCGISTDEVVAIIEADEEGLLDLNRFQFCPKRPSLLHAKSKLFVFVRKSRIHQLEKCKIL